MSKITSSKKIVPEDYPATGREVIQRLAGTLNPHLDQVTSALSSSLTYRDNLKSKIYGIDLPAGISTYTVAWDLNEKPTAAYIGQLSKSDGTAPAAAFALSWRYADKKIFLTFIGLDGATHHISTVIGQI